jgi:SAM-dependent methyltransferase
VNAPLRHDRSAAYRAYYEEGYEAEHPLAYDLGPDTGRADELRAPTMRWLERLGVSQEPMAIILELGSGMGSLRDVHPGYVGLDFSGTALRRGKDLSRVTRFVHGDMQTLPFKGESLDLIFSWAAIEHVPFPELVLEEVERVLKKGGHAILAPAWNCRSWTVKRLDVRPYRGLSVQERLEKFTIPLRSRLAWRALWSVPGRIRREAISLLGRQTAFDYVRLFPDFSLGLPHVSDDDAQASIDPHSAILFYKSRGWDIVSHPGLISRFLARHEPVIVRKPDR